MENHDVINIFFKIGMHEGLDNEIYLLTYQCLADLGGTRCTMFTSMATRVGYVLNFSNHLIQLMNPAFSLIGNDDSLCRAFLRIIYKFQFNFTLRSFGAKNAQPNVDVSANQEALQSYIKTLYDFTLNLIQYDGISRLKQYCV